MKRTILCILATLCATSTARALQKEEVLVVYNRNASGSKELADYYVSKRGIPAEHVLGIATAAVEHISRPLYLSQVEGPVKTWLDQDDHKQRIRCIVLMRGVPLGVERVDDPEKRGVRDREFRAWKQAEDRQKKFEAERDTLKATSRDGKSATKEMVHVEKEIAVAAREAEVHRKAHDAAKAVLESAVKNTDVCIDSELAVMYFENHPVQNWMPNMLNYHTWSRPGRRDLPKTFMVCRLDGPKEEHVRRIIDDSVAVEATGLRGIAYFDARNLRVTKADSRPSMWAFDDSILAAAAMLQTTGIKTVLDTNEALFAPGSAPDAALYCGWYKLWNYVPAFQWTRGAVGFHVASGEAATLRNADSNVWCKRMIEEGVAATFGPVHEPYLSAFPVPRQFFAFLLTGEYTVCEAYFYTAPVNSWMMTLVADPLYRPFAKNPQLTIERMKEVLKD